MAENTPTQEAMVAAVKSYDIKDGDRTITIRKPSVLAQYRFIDMLGNGRASNEAYVKMALPMIYVSAVDGEAIPPMTKHSELEALIQRLDESGIVAVGLGIEQHYGAIPTPAETAAKIKK